MARSCGDAADARAGGETDVRLLGKARHQRVLQIGPMSDEIGRLPAPFGCFAKRHPRQLAQRGRLLEHDRLRPHRRRQQPVEHAELAKDARCVG